MGKRLFSAFLILALCVGMLTLSYQNHDLSYSDEATAGSAAGAFATLQRDETLILWYADEALSEFLTSEALAYQAQTGVHVEPRLVSGVDYLEQINTASVYDGEEASDGSGTYEAPDLYITTHDTLLRAHLAGLASEISDPHTVVLPENYPNTSLHAISCKDKYVAYPLYYETNFFLYNKTYMRDIASAKVEEQIDRAEGEAAQEAVDESGGEPADADGDEEADSADGENGEDAEFGEEESEESEDSDPMGEEDVQASPEVLKQLSTMIPQTIDDIKTFANNYEAPEAVEAVFKWDV
ncbi:MAG: hypothetical protein IKR47_04240, partial [Lachnospiraceae bacterium]|nr:hypothetical protein [Lachnospiraceae bacterium]